MTNVQVQVVVALVVALLLGVAAAIGLTLSNSSNNTRLMYESCISHGNSPDDCRKSVGHWGDSGPG